MSELVEVPETFQKLAANLATLAQENYEVRQKLAQRTAILKECIEAMEYAVNHEHDAMWHEPEVHHSDACQFCARIDPVIFKAKKVVK